MENHLIHLARKHKTDKLDHGYIPFYSRSLPKNPKKILEIGVKEGASIRMWREFFPSAEIWGLDLFEEFPEPYIEGSRFVKGSQIDTSLLQKLRAENFDVIIDDGSHNSRDQMITFFGLYSETTTHYYIEDLHCCEEEFYRQGLPFKFTAKSVFNNNSTSILSKIILI